MIGDMPAWLQVKPDNPIEARLVLELVRQIEERTFVAGLNCRIHSIPGLGVTVEGTAATVNFQHPWDAVLSGSQMKIATGLVNGVVPWIDKFPMDGLDDKGVPLPAGVPMVKLDQQAYDSTGRSWICLQATIDPETGKLLDAKDGGLKIIQSKNLFIGDGGAVDQDNKGLWPLAMLRRPATATEGYGTVYDVTYFNLNHRYVAATGDGVKARHFFWV